LSEKLVGNYYRKFPFNFLEQKIPAHQCGFYVHIVISYHLTAKVKSA